MNTPNKTHKKDQLNDEVRILAREHARLALEALVHELRNGIGQSRVLAAEIILDRALGKSAQGLNLEGSLEVDPILPDEVLNILDGVYMSMR